MGLLAVIWHLAFRLLVLTSRLSATLSHSSQLHSARFARADEAEPLTGSLTDGTRLLLGEGHCHHVLRVRPTPTRRELGNLLVVAQTRGGKGLLAVSQLLTWPHSVIVNDIKGDLFAQTAGYRSRLGPIHVFDPKGVGDRFDPLGGRQTEDELYSSASHLLFQAEEGEGRIFTQRATVMLTQMLLAARREGAPPLPFIRFLIRLGLAGTASCLNDSDPELATQFLDIEFSDANFADRFLLSAWGTLTARMRPLLTETVIRCLAGSGFTPGDLMRSETPITVYLRWPERDLLALSPLVRLIWGSMIDELVATYDRAEGKNCHPVLLLVDEAGRTAIPSLADHATTVVGRGVSLWLAVQSLSQLDVVYGKIRAQVLRDNMESQVYYRPSNHETAEYLERCLGRTSEYAHTHTLREGTKVSQGLSEQAVPLLTAGEIKQLRDEDIMIFHRHYPPLRAKRMDWRRFSLLTKRHSLPLPKLRTLPPPEFLYEQARPFSYIDPDEV